MQNNTYSKTILFFSPYFGYTGSEIMLLELIKSLDQKLFTPHLFLFSNGELAKEIPEHLPYYLPQYFKRGWKARLKQKITRKKNQNHLEQQLTQIQKSIKADLWYVNTIAVNPQVYEIAGRLGVKIVTHVHELIFAYGFFPDNHLRNMLAYSSTIIGCSKAVCNSLEEIGFTNTDLQYNFIDTDKINRKLNENTISRSSLNIQNDEFIWVVSARSTFLKGIDYLPKILNELGTRKYKIIWIGSTEGSSLSYYIESWIEKHHPDRVIFPGKLTSEYYHYMMLADGFLIPSREESFSLVAVEASYLGIPIVCFDYGAASEVIRPESGTIVHSWNITDLVKAMIKLMESRAPQQIKTINNTLQFTKVEQLPAFHTLLKRLTC